MLIGVCNCIQSDPPARIELAFTAPLRLPAPKTGTARGEGVSLIAMCDI